MGSDEIISEGHHVVLSKNFDSGNIKIIPVVGGSIIHYGKLTFDPSPLIGSKYGSVFEIVDNTMRVVDDFESFDSELGTILSNKLLTFNDKSKFSQEKIIKKKKKQNHANIVTALRPSLALINEMMYARDKLGGLRLDVLAQILTLANIQNGSKSLLMDHNLGLLTSAIMSRILPDGLCIQLVPDNEAIGTTRNTLSMLNIGHDSYYDKLLAITMRDFYKVHSDNDCFQFENDILQARGQEHIERLSQETGGSSFGDLQETLIKKDTNRDLRNRERVNAASFLKTRSLDSIILITQNDHPLQILKLSYSFLAPSRQIVIYSDTIEPLLECYDYLKTNSMAVSLNLSESWFRRYQVLPDRTRPLHRFACHHAKH